MTTIALVGRSSSHFTRVARMFALDLGVAHAFRPVLDLTSVERDDYAGNPALKIPVLVDERGPLFGTENVCRELVRRSGRAPHVVLRGDTNDRLVANAEELTLHAMATEVSLIMAKATGAAASPKVVRSLEGTLGWLDANVDALVAALPAARTLSFVEVSLYCLVTHLPWREVLDVSPWTRLGAFAARFGERESARSTAYRFDAR